MGTVFVGVTKDGQTFAGDIKNLARGRFFLDVPGEPNGPTIAQSLLSSLVGGCFHSQHHKILFAYYMDSITNNFHISQEIYFLG